MREGKFDFDHHFALMTVFLRRFKNFLLGGIFFGSSKGSFSKKDLTKTDLPFRFCKIGLRNTVFIFGRKIVVCFVANTPILTYFKKHGCSMRAEKDAIMYLSSTMDHFPTVGISRFQC